MSLTIVGGTSSIIIKRVEFETSSNSFYCYEDSSSDPVFSVPLPFNYPGDPDAGITEKIYFLVNDLMPSSKLYKLKLKERPTQDQKVGFIFPLGALFNNPAIFDNVHYQKVAYIVLKKLLTESDLSIPAKETGYRSDAAYSVFDFYNEDLIIAVIADQLVNFAGYSFENYLSAFYKLGFRFVPQMDFSLPPSDCDTIKANFTNLQSSISLRAASNNLHTNFFIKGLLNNELFSKENEIARFHLYYQVVELLMEKVFKNEIKLEIIQQFSRLPAFDIKDILRESMRDTFSLGKLVGGQYSVISNDIVEELKISIEAFFAYVNIDKIGSDIDSRIYKIRNHLFHGYSKLLEQNSLSRPRINSLLKKVNDSFEYLIVELVMSYKDRSLPTP
jgi:hypothetical protein